jgi:3-phosphoshikimate 1-carboxyvinyltransferase
MIREIPTSGPVDAVLQVPGSKSITNRALACAALAPGASTILNASDSEDTALMANGLNQLGVLARRQERILAVEGTGGRLFAPRYPIPVGNAGTTLRFLCSLAALGEGTTIFEADPRMADRPIDDLFDALRALGVRASADGARFTVTGGGLKGGTVPVRSGKSSQFLSSLLLVAPYAKEALILREEGAVASRPYLDMTLEVMRLFGCDVERQDEHSFRFIPGMHYQPGQCPVEADASGASYFFAAAAIAGGTVQVQSLRRRSMQGDMGFLTLLERMGCVVAEGAGGIRVSAGAELQGIDADLNTMPDMVPTLAVTALFARGGTRIRNVAHLRYKESDRLAALAEELARIGASVVVHEDGLEITPGSYRGAQLDTHEDHRLAMSLALIGLRVPGISIENPGVVRKSFPGFWGEFEKLGRGRWKMEN